MWSRIDRPCNNGSVLHPLNLIASNLDGLRRALEEDQALARDVAAGEILHGPDRGQELQALAREAAPITAIRIENFASAVDYRANRLADALKIFGTPQKLGHDASLAFWEELRRLFEPPPGLSDSLKVTIEVRNFADGTLASARVTRTSGSREFDRAVLDAIGRMRMPPRPDRKSDVFNFIFTMKERNED